MNNAVRFIIPTSKREYDYVGFNAEISKSEFVFPCQYIDPDSDERYKRGEARKITALIKTVATRYRYDGSGEETQRFYAMSWLVRDFLEKGYYEEKEKTVGITGSGKISWQKTFRNSRLLYDNGSFIYRDLYRHKTVTETSGQLAEIYKCALGYSVGQIGFLYGIDRTEPSKYRIDEASVTFMLHVLGRALSETNNDYKRVMFRHLMTVLTGLCGPSVMQGASMRENEFEYVFEYLVNSVFGTESVRDYYSHSSYVIDGCETAASKMRPDTVMKNPLNTAPDYFVIDSKYYNYGYTRAVRDLPQSASVTKQISYNHYLEDMYSADKKAFYSIFLLPYGKKENESPIRYVGYAKNEAEEPRKNENKVAVCLIDLKTLVDAYFGDGRSGESLRTELASIVLTSCFGTGGETGSRA